MWHIAYLKSSADWTHDVSRARDPHIPSELRWCPKCRDDTEFRLNKVGFDKNGFQRTRWRCVPCRNRQAKGEE